jgi:predicted ferric reductase
MPAVGFHLVGPVVVLFSVVVGWFAFTNTISKDGDSGVGFSLFIGSVSILLMTWSNLLSTRAKIFENTFGGLDRMYRWHRWYGALSVGAMWLHLQMVDDVEGIRGASRDVADAAEDLADTGSTLLYILVAISLLRWLPTRWWRLSHKLLVLPYAFACWHFYTSTKPYPNDSAWGWWFNIMMLLGLAAWFYRVIWRDMIRRGYQYRVQRITQHEETVTLDLVPVGDAMNFTLGQFAFLKPQIRGMSEPHPFTIASHPDDPYLRFIIRNLGDWTSNLSHLIHEGDRITVEGPYGAFQPLPAHSPSQIIWIAGGVGITPFLGSVRAQHSDKHPIPHLFYCVRSASNAPGLQELEQAHNDGRIHLHLHESSAGNRLTAHHVEQVCGGSGLQDAHVVMCGPDSLISSMKKTVRTLGVRHVHVEGFDIRTGVGPDMSVHIDRAISRAKNLRN